MADELTEQPKAFSLPPAPELTAVQGQMGGLPTVPDYAKTRQKFKTSKDASEEAARQLQRSTELEQQIGSAKLAQEQYGAEAKASIASQERQAAQRIEQSLDETRARFPYPEFHPTKDNMETLTGLFSIIGLVGFAMGGSGKQSALLALNSMSGMMKGWQQGRADLYKREKDEYEKQVANVKRILDDAYRDADRAHKMLAYNRQEAEALAAQSSAKLGGQVGRQILEKQGVDNYFKYIEGVKKDLQHAEELVEKRKQHQEEMALKRKQFDLQERRMELQEKKLELQEKKKTDTGDLPKDAKTKEEYRARYEIIKNVEDIQSLLEDPKYARLITPATKFMPDFLANLQKNYPELSQKLARIQAIEFQIGGKALTASEQKILAPIYGWRGLSPSALKERLAGVKENLQDVNNMTEVYYPGLKNIHSQWDSIYAQKGKVPEVPSAGGGDLQTRVQAAFGEYEPEKYDYRVTEDGRVQRKKKE